jgi:hypothetical protein
VGLFSSFKQTKPSATSRSCYVRRAELTAVPAGAGWHAVAVRGQPETRLWPSFAVDFLLGCAQFKPLAAHINAYSRVLSLQSDHVRDITHWSTKMFDAGLLVEAGSVVERCIAASSGPGDPARIDAIGIPTAGNEQRLRRVITTFARNARQYGRSPHIAVSANGSAPLDELIVSLARGESVKITLLDDAKRSAFATRLAKRADVDPEVAAFAMSDSLGAGFACGANRNALLLQFAGRPYLSLDDDVACEMAAAPDERPRDGLAIFASRDGFERWFYPEYARAFERRRSVECDYLALHETMLGHSTGAFLAREREPDFIGVSDDLLRRLQKADARIVATFTGHYGHPGVPTSYYYLTYRGETLARLTGEGEGQYRAFLASGGVCALVPQMAIADASLSPGMAIGIDARTLIPPFPPVMHAEDFVWGAAVWHCCASGFAGHVSVAVRHDPGIGRGIIAPPLLGCRPVALWEFAHLLRGVVCRWVPPLGTVDDLERMDSLGRYLCEIAAAPGGDFQEYVRQFVIRHESDKIGFMEESMQEESAAPEFWRKDLFDYIEQTRLALAEPDFDIPFDMRAKWPAPEARALIQRIIFAYGRLLRAWPALVAAASTESVE